MKKEEIFWNWFRENEKAYHNYNATPDSPQKDEITLALARKLQEYCDHLHFEFIQNFYKPGKEHFIITARCYKQYFEQAFKLVEYAPRDLSHWFFEALLPPAKRYTEHYTIDFEGIKLDPQEIWFRPMVNNLDPSQFGVMLGVKAYHRYKDHEDIGMALQKLLLTEIGELSLTHHIHHLDMSPLPADPAKNGYYKLNQLPNVINWYFKHRVKLSKN